MHASVCSPPLSLAAADQGSHPAIIVVLVDAGHVMRVQRVVLRCDGVESVRAMPLGRHTEVRVEVRCGATHAADVIAELDACVRKGDIGRLTRFVDEASEPRSRALS